MHEIIVQKRNLRETTGKIYYSMPQITFRRKMELNGQFNIALLLFFFRPS